MWHAPFLVTKNIWSPFDIPPPSNGDQIFWVAIWHTHTIGWWPKHFNHRSMVGVCQMATQKIWSPFDKSPIDGNQIFSIARKGGPVICFWKALNKLRSFQKYMTRFPSVVTKIFGHHKVWRLKKFDHLTLWWLIFFWLPHGLMWPKHV